LLLKLSIYFNSLFFSVWLQGFYALVMGNVTREGAKITLPFPVKPDERGTDATKGEKWGKRTT
jgi:hypothetical protein